MRRPAVLGLAIVAPAVFVATLLVSTPDAGELIIAVGTPTGPTAPATEPPSVPVSTTTTTTTTSTVPPSPLPRSVSPATLRVGVGGVGTIEGTCAGSRTGPVVIWEVGETVRAVDTAITAADWTFAWTAPQAADVEVLQVWCGDPAGWSGGYPAALQVTIEYVAQATPDDTNDDMGGLPVLPDSR